MPKAKSAYKQALEDFDKALNEANKPLETPQQASAIQALDDHVKDAVNRRRSLKAKLSAIRQRGFTNSQLDVELPDDLYGEWVAKDEVSVRRMQALGFQLDDKYSRKNALHDDGVKGSLGDVVFMTAEKETKEILKEIDRENYIRAYGTPEDMARMTAEVKQFEDGLVKMGGVPKINETETERVGFQVNATKHVERQKELASG
jgi:hypothetical protein